MPDGSEAYHRGGGEHAHEPDEFLSDRQLAEMLGVTTRTTLRWRRDGGGPRYVRVGERRILYARADVLAWTASKTFTSLAAEAKAGRGCAA
jgi:predicted DNA-binding transcriptional regulator AlpA